MSAALRLEKPMKYLFLLAGFFLVFFCCINVYAENSSQESTASADASRVDFLSVSPEGSLVNTSGEVFQLKGISSHNLAWYPEYVNETALRTLKNFGINTIRLCVYPNENGGYCTSEDAATSLKDILTSSIETARSLDMYVIVDWHILSDTAPDTCKDQAIEFFEYISGMYGSCPNIIYEICSEPGDISWDDLKLYSTDIIDCIRRNAPDSIIITGLPSWCQDPAPAIQSPIDRKNILYSFHFNAASSTDEVRSTFENAAIEKLPLIVSQFSAVDSSGNGTVDTDSADAWLSMLNYYRISYVFWNLSNNEESGSLLSASCTDPANWSEESLSQSGKWFLDAINSDVISDNEYIPGLYCSRTMSSSEESIWSFNNGCSVSVTSELLRSDETSSYISYTVKIINSSSSALSGWRLRLTWNNIVTPSEYWSCDIGGTDNSRLIVPVDYNSSVPSGSEVEFGLIVSCSSMPDLTNVSFE